jgi:hypothetical protein
MGLPPMSPAALPGCFDLGRRRFRPQPNEPSGLSQCFIIGWGFGSATCTIRAACSLPNVTIGRLPLMPMLTLPGCRRFGIRRFRPQPDKATLPGQGLIIGGSLADTAGAIGATCSAPDTSIGSLPLMSPAALPGRFDPGRRRFRPQPDKASLPGQMVIIGRRFGAITPTVRTPSSSSNMAISRRPGVALPTLPPSFTGDISHFRP